MMGKETTTSDGLPLNLEDLIHRRSIESNRVEFKATWSKPIKAAVVRSVCAFANDLLNLNGGYIVLGIEAEDETGRAIMPPRGLEGINIDSVQREIRGACKRLLPAYQPLLFPASCMGKDVLVVWAPGGDNRPYEAPENAGKKSGPRHYYVRQGPETVMARGEVRRQLLEAAAKVPFDDRRNLDARVEDISPTLVRRFLHDIRSDLANRTEEIDDRELYRRLRIVTKVNAHEVPRNAGLLFFNEGPDSFFSGAQIEVVQFGDDAGGDLIEERVFKGPLPQLIKGALGYLDALGGSLVHKISGQAEVERTVPYPYEAMEEAIVNAVYHRSYDSPPEPTKIYLYPDRMEITSYPGPVAGIQRGHFAPTETVPPVPARNRRIGEFLKELRLAEGRGTGIPKIRRKMEENGSPEARFDFDDARTYFRVILPVHPRYQVLHGLREASHLWAIGEKDHALSHLQRAFDQQPSSGALASQLIEYTFGLDKPELADRVMETFEATEAKGQASQPYLTLARLLLDRNRPRQAEKVLRRIPPSRTIDDTIEAAILKKRSTDFEGAHHLFAEAYSLNPDDPKLIHEFAQTKIGLSRNMARRRGSHQIRKRLNKEASELLRRAIQLSEDSTREAWCWFDLARTLDWLRGPKSEVEAAFLRAQSMLPSEPRFRDSYDRWKSRISPNGQRKRT